MTYDLAYASAAELAALIARRAVSPEAWFEDCDIVASPTLSRTALAIGHDFFSPIEIDGTIADTVRLLRAAALYEMARPWAGDRPPLPAG